MNACKADISGRIMVGGVEHVQSSDLVKVSEQKRQHAGSLNKHPKMSKRKKKSVINTQLISVLLLLYSRRLFKPLKAKCQKFTDIYVFQFFVFFFYQRHSVLEEKCLQ